MSTQITDKKFFGGRAELIETRPAVCGNAETCAIAARLVQAFGKNFLTCRAKSASESSAVLPSSQSQKCFAKYGLSA